MDRISSSYCNMNDDLLYKGVHYKWTFSCSNEKLNVNNVLDLILAEDVKMTFNSAKESLHKLLPILETLIAKKDQVDVRFGKMVNEKPISGSVLGSNLILSLKLLIPNNLVGGIVNKKKLIFSFQKAFKFGYKDVFPLHFLTSDIQLHSVTWLKNLSNNDKKVIISKLVKWLWKIIKRLVASKYYVTESQGNYCQLVYISKKTWQSQTDAAFNHCVNSGTWSFVSPADGETYSKIKAPSKLRWLPKKSGLRPIVYNSDDKRQSGIIHAKAFLRGILKNAYEGISVKSLHSACSEVFKKCHANKIDHLYFVAIDVHDAYGSIIQDKLIQILEKRVTTLLGGTGINIDLHFETVSLTSNPVTVCRELTSHSVQYGRNKSVDKLFNVMNTIMNAIKLQTIKKEKTMYLINKGISQAMPLSAALCNIYLSELDRTELTEFTGDSDGCLIRAVDDYLYITPNKDNATRFLQLMSKGFSHYGIHINPGKTQSNLDSELEDLSYYGFLINTVNWQISVNYRDNDIPFRNLQTVSKPAPPLTILEHKMIRAPHCRITELTMDRAYMSELAVERNVFEMACFMACLFKAIIDTLRLHDASPDTLLHIISKSIEKVTTKVARLTAPEGIPKKLTRWIMLKAFVLCLEHSFQNGVIEAVLHGLVRCEDDARRNVSPGKLRTLNKTVNELPPRFRTGY